MSCDGLDHCSQIRSGDTEDECPIVLWVQVRIGQNKHALIASWLKLVPHDDIEQILCVELLSTCVLSDASPDQTVCLEVVEVELYWRILISLY